MSEQQRLQAAINGQIALHVPRDAWESTVPIVLANRPYLYPFGTGTLFQIADSKFVITAGHVIEQAHMYDRTLGIGAVGSFVPMCGEAFFSGDPFDIALFCLPTDVATLLAGKRFLRLDDVDFQEQSASSVFTLFGFPAAWAQRRGTDAEVMDFKALEYTTYSFEGNTETLCGYHPKYHLLLGANVDENTGDDGAAVVFENRGGETMTFPRELKGISGCGVWVIGDLKAPLSEWGHRRPKLVAVETSIYQDSQVIRATRWAAVTTLLYRAFPDLQSALDLWRI